jgi:xylulokinase
MALYLGLDCSTQSLSATIIEVRDDRRRVAFERSIEFDDAFPGYGTTNGVRRSPADPSVVVSSPLMWADALERMMAIVASESRLDLAELRAISGAGQQHGSVYFDAGAGRALAALDPSRPLGDQIRGCLSHPDSPVWMDTSTSAECTSIEAAVGGPAALARLTGSRAFERFTGPQIRKLFRRDPDTYARTDRVHLVSSYLASLLAGRHAPLEPGDAAGMNLMDIVRCDWAPAALDATAPDLARRLPPIRPSWTPVGVLAPYWARRFGLPPAKVIVWTGDNPSSLIGAGLVAVGRAGISLGTSDTLFAPMRAARVDPSGVSNVFGSPAGSYMSLVCFSNGSLARDRVRESYGMTWDGFSRALQSTPPGNDGAVLLPWFEPEITPPITNPGVRRYGLDANDAPANIRAVVETQLLAMRRHSAWIGERIDTIHATGGAAVNRDILQVVADVFDADVYQLAAGNTACLGAALRAYHADVVSEGRRITWPEVTAQFAEPVAASRVSPVRDHVAAYAGVEPVHAACEAHARGIGGDPTPLLQTYRATHAARS